MPSRLEEEKTEEGVEGEEGAGEGAPLLGDIGACSKTRLPRDGLGLKGGIHNLVSIHMVK